MKYGKAYIVFSVFRFAVQMIKVLLQPKNFEKGGWEDCDNEYLADKLTEEVDELFDARDNKEIKKECIDVGNIAMMIYMNHKEASSHE